MKVIVSISGPPGSGKTTLAKAISKRFDLDTVLAGQIFRKMAEERGMSIEGFGKYSETHPEMDIELDNLVIERIKNGVKDGKDMLLEGRLTGFLLYRAKIPSFRIYVTARPEVRAERIRKREGGEIKDILRRMVEREECDRGRYLKEYSFDTNDMSIYDIVIDSSDMSVEEVLGEATKAIERWNGE